MDSNGDWGFGGLTLSVFWETFPKNRFLEVDERRRSPNNKIIVKYFIGH